MRPAEAPGRARWRPGPRASAQHPHQLADHRVAVQRAHRGRRRGHRAVLDDREVAIRQRRHLGQVGDAQDLPARRQGAQVLADRPRGVAADPGVDLVEHQQSTDSGELLRNSDLPLPRRFRRPRPCATLSRASITRESSPPEATSRSGAERAAGVGGDQHLDRVGAAGPAAVRARRQLDLEARVGHGQLGQALAHGGGQLGRPGAARLAQPTGQRVALGARLRELGLQRLERCVGVAPARRGARGSARRGRARRRSCRRACAPGAPAGPAAPPPPPAGRRRPRRRRARTDSRAARRRRPRSRSAAPPGARPGSAAGGRRRRRARAGRPRRPAARSPPRRPPG